MATKTVMAKGDRIGLYMIVASLSIIGVMIAMIFDYQLTSHERRIRTDGISLARLLSGIPYEDLAGRQSMLEIVQRSWQNGDFAYAAIVGPDSVSVGEVASAGVIVPNTAFPERPDNWISEREFRLTSGAGVIEIQAPLIEESRVAGYLRLGFFKPEIAPRLDQLPFVATLAFLVFLLTPIFYLLIRREVRPLRQANEELTDLVQDGRLSELNLRATGELGEFMNNFNEFIKLTKGRMQALETEQTNLNTRTQLLSYKKSRIESVLDSIPEAIIIIDQSGTISFANQRVENLLGASVADVMEKDPNEWCDNVDVLEVLLRYSSSESAKQYLAQTVCIKPKKSSERNISIKAYPLFAPNDTGTIYGTLIVIRDVTKEVLAQQGQSEFVNHVAHELKTPLNTIGLIAERLLYEDGLSESTRIESGNIIQDQVERMSGLIGNLLNITKLEMGELPIERRPVKLREFLEDIFATVTRSHEEKNLEFNIDLEKEFSGMFLDKDLLRIAIDNLLTNAIKYSRPGGTVTLTGRETEDRIRISVKDDGIGISAEDQRRIFDKFFRSDDAEVRERAGHGLGLSLTQDIVQLHNGTLTVDSKMGRGSEFVIELRKETGMLKQVV